MRRVTVFRHEYQPVVVFRGFKAVVTTIRSENQRLNDLGSLDRTGRADGWRRLHRFGGSDG